MVQLAGLYLPRHACATTHEAPNTIPLTQLHYSCVLLVQELYRKVTWPLYRIYGHAFEAMKTMVNDDGAGIFKRLDEENKGPLEVLTPEVRRHGGLGYMGVEDA